MVDRVLDWLLEADNPSARYLALRHLLGRPEQDPEVVAALMNECFSGMGDAVTRHGGTIDKFIGDCMMAVFGVPTALEDAPRQAVNTAIELKRLVHHFREEKQLDVPLDIHIGINTGEGISGEVGSESKRDYTVMGDAVNLASRLEDVSEAGQILVGESTYNSTRSGFSYRELPPVAVKGKEKPVPVYELLSRRESRRRAP